MSLNANQERTRNISANHNIDATPTKSGGPKTEEGKAKSALNSRKHGLYAETIVFESEEQLAKFERMSAQLVDDYSPRTLTEELIVSRIATCHWRIIQGYAYEAKYRAETPDFNPDKFTRAISAAERSLTQAEKEFQLHRSNKLDPAPPLTRHYRVNNTPNPKPKTPPRPYQDPYRPDEIPETEEETRQTSRYYYPAPTVHPVSAMTPEGARHILEHGCLH